MNGLVSARGAGSAALRVALLAAMLMLAAGTSQADRDNGRGSGRGGRTHNGGGDRNYNRGGSRQDGGGGGTYNGRDRKGGGGGGTYNRGGNRHDGGGGSTYNGGGDRKYKGGGGGTYNGGGGRVYGGGGGRVYGGGGGRAYDDCGPTYAGGGRYYGGRRYYGAPSYRYARPRTVLSFGIGLGLPYYCPPAYHRYYVEHVQVVSSTSIDVDNYPPAGCYYYDPSCDREFSNLDDYTDHIDGQDHPRTIEIVLRNSGDRIRTLEFVDGAWRVDR